MGLGVEVEVVAAVVAAVVVGVVADPQKSGQSVLNLGILNLVNCLYYSVFNRTCSKLTLQRPNT